MKTFLKKGVPENELHVIKFPVNKLSEIEWTKEGKEFRHKGSMYDVVKFETEKDSISYYCVNDVQETMLFAHLEEIINQQIDNDKSPAGRAAKFLFKIFNSLNYFHTENFTFNPNSSSFIPTFVYGRVNSFIFLEVPTPPPDFLA
ncbi:MAG: hypothetical protein Q8L81_15945 [Bacteroidota bacterium]|nr:hypothetical protein [Bacteroidota bacterium]